MLIPPRTVLVLFHEEGSKPGAKTTSSDSGCRGFKLPRKRHTTLVLISSTELKVLSDVLVWIRERCTAILPSGCVSPFFLMIVEEPFLSGSDLLGNFPVVVRKAGNIQCGCSI